MNIFSTFLFRSVVFLSLLPLLAHAADFHVLTDAQGREVKAELLSLNGDRLKIKRHDGQIFTISLSTLSAASQGTVRHWADIGAAKINPDDITINLSRVKVDSHKSGSGNSTTTTDEWAYSVRIKNESPKTIPDLQIKYILFAKDSISDRVNINQAKTRRLEGETFAGNLDGKQETSVRTGTIATERRETKSTKGTKVNSRDEFYGIWLRVYSGDQLLKEQSSPEHLISTEVWKGKTRKSRRKN